jgi:hypothetical protein
MTTSANHVLVQISGSLVIDAAGSATISIDGAVSGSLARSYNGSPQVVTATTANPSGLSYSVSYAGTAGTVYPASTTAPTNAGQYSVTATITNPNHAGSAPATATLTITPAAAAITFGTLDFSYDGAAHATTATLTQEPATVCSIDYNDAGAGTGSPPVNAGEYPISATCTGSNYAGTTTATLLVRRKNITINLAIPPAGPYDGNDRAANATVSGDVLPADPATPVVLYDGNATPLPRNAGSYSVQAALAPKETNYTATPASGTLVITKATTTLVLGNLSQTFGSVTPVTATPGASLSGSIAILYDGSATLPSAVGSYAVSATINDPNYSGSASGTLTIATASANSIAANGSIATSSIAGALLPGAQPSVRITDGTNPVAGVAVSFSVTAGAGSLSGANAVTDSNGIATLAGWTLGANPGVQTVLATAAGITGGVDFTTTSTAQVGLSVSVDDGRGYTQTGEVLNYLVVIGNAGPSNAAGVGISSSLASQFAPGSVSWLCFASPGSSCGASTTGSGNLPASITIATGGSVSFLLSATVQVSANETILYAVTATPPAGAAGAAASDSDETDIVLFRDGFESSGSGAEPGDGEGARAGSLIAGLDLEALRPLLPRTWLSGQTADGCRFRVEFVLAGEAVQARLLAAPRGGDLVAQPWMAWPQEADVPALSARNDGARNGELQLSGGGASLSAPFACSLAAAALRAGELQVAAD